MHVVFITLYSADMVGKQGVAAPVSSRLVCQPCFMCQLLHHCVNASLLLHYVAGRQQYGTCLHVINPPLLPLLYKEN
jgi:hypothetical protein